MFSTTEDNEDPTGENIENKEKKLFLNEMEINEWNMELRRNNICMDEHNVDIRMQKIKESEKIKTQRVKARKKMSEEREQINVEKERKISASADGGPRSRVCARLTLRSAPHRH
jgi:hypothetical protein